jgi:hypothetical protein
MLPTDNRKRKGEREKRKAIQRCSGQHFSKGRRQKHFRISARMRMDDSVFGLGLARHAPAPVFWIGRENVDAGAGVSNPL